MKYKVKRNLSTKKSREFWAAVDKICSENPRSDKELGKFISRLDPYTDMYSDLSPGLIK